MGLNLQLSPMTAVGGPLVVALCTEFTSLILLRFIEERHPPKEAVEVTASPHRAGVHRLGPHGHLGRGRHRLSSLPLLRDFGAIVAMNVTVALLSALVFLPPMLVWAEERGWVTRGLRKPPPIGGPTPTSAPLPTPAPSARSPHPSRSRRDPGARTKPDLDRGHDRRMTDDVLGDRALGRATLARQILLEREDRDLTATVDHLVGLQAQVPHNPYTALWSRLEPFDPEALSRLLSERLLVRIVTCAAPSTWSPRTTPCGCARWSSRSSTPSWPATRPSPRCSPASTSARSWPSKPLLDERPRTPSSGAHGRACPSTTPPRAFACRNRLALVQVPPRGCGGGGQVDDHGRGVAGPAAGSRAVHRRRRPALPGRLRAGDGGDVATWSRLTGFREVLDRLRPRLRTFRDERGRELFDLQDAPRPDPDTPAPSASCPSTTTCCSATPTDPAASEDRDQIAAPCSSSGAWARCSRTAWGGRCGASTGSPAGDRPSSPCARSGS